MLLNICHEIKYSYIWDWLLLMNCTCEWFCFLPSFAMMEYSIKNVNMCMDANFWFSQLLCLDICQICIMLYWQATDFQEIIFHWIISIVLDIIIFSLSERGTHLFFNDMKSLNHNMLTATYCKILLIPSS